MNRIISVLVKDLDIFSIIRGVEGIERVLKESYLLVACAKTEWTSSMATILIGCHWTTFLYKGHTVPVVILTDQHTKENYVFHRNLPVFRDILCSHRHNHNHCSKEPDHDADYHVSTSDGHGTSAAATNSGKTSGYTNFHAVTTATNGLANVWSAATSISFQSTPIPSQFAPIPILSVLIHSIFVLDLSHPISALCLYLLNSRDKHPLGGCGPTRVERLVLPACQAPVKGSQLGDQG